MLRTEVVVLIEVHFCGLRLGSSTAREICDRGMIISLRRKLVSSSNCGLALGFLSILNGHQAFCNYKLQVVPPIPKPLHDECM